MSIALTAPIAPQERAIVAYSSAGHALMHLMTAFWPFIVVSLRHAWGEPGQPLDSEIMLLPLWQLGSFLLGLIALPAGWASDRWSAPGMLVVMFVGMGLASIGCGLVADRDFFAMQLGLAALGFFAAIYHSVGIAWVMRNAARPGQAMGINGVAGSMGLMACGLVTGFLVNGFGWRAAFIVPGVVCVLLGLALLHHWRTGVVGDRPMPRDEGAHTPAKADLWRVFVILTFTMFVGGIVFTAVMYGIPGLVENRMAGDIAGLQSLTSGFGVDTEVVFWVGVAGSLVYGVSGLFQYFAGTLADRYPLKTVYVLASGLQILAMLGVALLSGIGLLVAAICSAIFSAMSGPAENLLIGRYTPSKYHGLGFGAKFIVAFGAGPLAIELMRQTKARTGDLVWLFLGLAACAVLVWLAALMLPAPRRSGSGASAVPKPAPAE
jgi:FSR family fosmidomycin resistance protein-like MFS transporter